MKAAVALVIGAGLLRPADADVIVDTPPITSDPERGNFWRDMISPHKDEVDALVRNTRQALQTADVSLYSDYDPTGSERRRFYVEVLGALRYARRLAPDSLDVLRLLGVTADELGHTREALDALHAAVDVAGIDKAGVEVTGRLGVIYLRLGQLDDAVRFLRHAQGAIVPGQPISAHVLVHLSHALAARGQMTEAIDVLANSVPAAVPYYSNEVSLVAFALAVQLDRDEQRGAAFDVLDRMQNVLQGQFAAQIMNVLSIMRFSPAEDQHYYRGLLYEVAGNYSEARAEWALYAASGDPPYRRRATEHIAAIDALRRASPREALPQPPGVHNRRHPRPPMVTP